MDGADGGKTGLRSHLETTVSIKRRHGLETCDLTVRSLAEARIKAWRVLYIYNGIAFKGFQSFVPLREPSSRLILGLEKKNQMLTTFRDKVRSSMRLLRN